MDELTLKLVQSVEKEMEQTGNTDSVELDVDPLSKRFAMDAIGRVAFSMDFGAIEKPEDNAYMKYGNNFMNIPRFLLSMIAPGISSERRFAVFQ